MDKRLQTFAKRYPVSKSKWKDIQAPLAIMEMQIRTTLQ